MVLIEEDSEVQESACIYCSNTTCLLYSFIAVTKVQPAVLRKPVSDNEHEYLEIAEEVLEAGRVGDGGALSARVHCADKTER